MLRLQSNNKRPLLWGSILFLWSMVACAAFDSRPPSLQGFVTCHVIAETMHESLFVQVVLDEAAIQQHARLEIIREIMTPTTSHEEVSLLVVDIGEATGDIHTCGTFQDRAYRVDITNQMVAYPSWIRIRTRSEESVYLVIQDRTGANIVEPRLLEPTQFRYTVRWLR